MAREGRLYQKIADVIRQEIAAGDYDIQFPSEKELCERFQVGVGTIKTALALLTREGQIIRIPGKGTFVQNANLRAMLAESRDTEDGGLIGVILPKIQGPLFTHLLTAIIFTAERHNFRVILGISDGESTKESRVIQDLVERGARGLLIWPVDGEQYNETLLRYHFDGFPLVLVDRWLPGIDIPCVRTSHEMGAAQAMDELVRLGHQHIAFLSVGSENPAHTQSIQERLKGYQRACIEHGMPIDPKLIWIRPRRVAEDMAVHVNWIAEQWQANPHVTAALAVETYDLECIRQYAMASGRRIPDDLSVIGFDGGELVADRMAGIVSYFGSQDWTWIDQNAAQIGETATSALIETIQHGKNSEAVIIPTHLRRGHSTGPRPASEQWASESVGLNP
ncbi:MAG: GntR family transcriptional regulator [Firmicutes bacterium]|nr:GntR family transcriptional regulator [Bacillota bacterium]